MRLRNHRRYESVSEHSLEYHQNDLERGAVAQPSANREAAKYGERERSLGILGDCSTQFGCQIDLLPRHDRYRRVAKLRMRAAT
jgi:hypothetical protein